LPLKNEELADWVRETYKEAQDDDDKGVISEENTMTKGLRETFSKINKTGLFWNHDPIYVRLNSNWKTCCHAIKTFYKQQCRLDALPFISTHTCTGCEVTDQYFFEGKNI
jgi:hypothetical protein